MTASASDGGYLLDTHVWLWQVAGADSQPERFRRAIDEAADQVFISPISCWEVGLLARRGRIQLGMGPREWVDRALAAMPMRESPLTRDVALTSHEIDLPHRDPADRFLAATALVYGLTLITQDERLLAAHWLPTL